MTNELSVWNIVFTFRIIVALICGLGIVGEIWLLFIFDVEHPSKSKFTLAFYFILIILWLFYDRTNIFKREIVKINSDVFWAFLLIYIFIELLVYSLLFGEYQSSHRIHKFAPMNIILSTFLFAFLILSITGQSHLGFLNDIRSNRKNN
jgi:hypothetical protein